jgi:tetratricopeptide (TPR) repeat protein
MFNQNQKLIKLFDSLSYVFILLNIITIPLLVDKNITNFFVMPKQYVFIGFLLFNLLFFSIKTILEKKIFYRQSILDIPLLLFLGVGLVSSLFSLARYDSFLGRGESFIFNFVFLFFLVVFYLFLVNFLNTPERWRGVLDMILIGGGVASAFFILKVVLKFNIPFIGQALNTVDSVNSTFGLWMIPVFIISAGSLIKKNLSLGRNLFYFSIMLLSVTVLLAISFGFFWWIVLVGLILLLLLGVSFLQDARLGWLSALFALMIVSCIFIAFGSPKSLQTTVPAEISLDAKSSWGITKNILFSGAKNFLVGSGLGTFGSDFSKFRSVDFNLHPTAWNMRFAQPFNSFFAILSEGGALFMFGFAFILLFVLGHVFTTWFKARGSSFGILASLNLSKKNIRLDVFLAVVAWLVFTIGLLTNFYSVALWVFWWLLLGVIISGMSLLGHNVVQEKYFTMEDTPQYNLTFSFSMIVVMAVVVMVGILGARFYVAEQSYAKAMQETNSGVIESSLQKILSLRNGYDTYHASIARAYLVRAGELSKEPSPNVQAVGDYLKRAVNEARAATEISPNSVAVWENLATMYENTFVLVPDAGDWAVKSLNTAIELEPTNPILMWRLGNDYLLQNNPAKAAEYFQKSIDLKKDYLGSYIGLANAYESAKDLDRAVDVYKNLLQLGATNNTEILFNAGRVLYNRNKKGDKDDAEKLWLEAVKLQPNYSNALYSLALLYEGENQKQKALEYYYRVKDLNPGNKDIVNKIKSLLAGATK